VVGRHDGASNLNFAGNGMSRKTEALTTKTTGLFLDGVRQGGCKVPRGNRGIDIQSK
jgi:hypothetical protein